MIFTALQLAFNLLRGVTFLMFLITCVLFFKGIQEKDKTTIWQSVVCLFMFLAMLVYLAAMENVSHSNGIITLNQIRST